MFPAMREELPFQGARQEGARVCWSLCEQVHGHDKPDLSHLPGGSDGSIHPESPVIPFMFLFSDCVSFCTHEYLLSMITPILGKSWNRRHITYVS